MTVVLLFIGSFLLMELVSYASHRWVMHGFGMAWHRSHHAPPKGRFERNDLFPLSFSAVGVLLFAAASLGVPGMWPVAAGVTAYGAAYLVVHELVIHRRLSVPVPKSRYLTWLREAHADHHRRSGEPFGMLLPLVRDHRPGRSDRDPLDRSVPR